MLIELMRDQMEYRKCGTQAAVGVAGRLCLVKQGRFDRKDVSSTASVPVGRASEHAVWRKRSPIKILEFGGLVARRVVADARVSFARASSAEKF